MAEISSLLTLQGQLALLTLIGFFLARKGIINAQGRKCLTDLLINVILPANIIQSFLVEFSWDVLKSSASILVISLALQIGCVVLCALGYNWLPFARRSVYQYGTVCSNGAFLGSALVDGIWGSSGLLLSSKGHGLLWPYSLMQLGMNSNKSADALAGSYGLFAFSCIFWLGTMFLLAWLLLKKRDVRA